MTNPARPNASYGAPGSGLTAHSLKDVDDETLGRFHVLLEAVFPPSELMTYEELREARTGPSTKGTLLLRGNEPVAGSVTEDYVDGRVLLLAYLAVATSARNAGLGSELLAEVAGPQRAQRPLVLAEIEDPRFHPASEAAGDPVARLRFYDRARARLLPLPYSQPSLRPGVPRVEQLLLIAIDAQERDIDGTLVADFLEEYYEVCEGEDIVRSDPAFMTLRELALGDEQGRLRLHPLGALDMARPPPD